MTSSSCIVWQSENKSVILLDLPRSVEEAQVSSKELTAANGDPRKLRRLISADPPAAPFPTPEPKTGGPGPPAASPSAQVAELMTQAAVESALEEIRVSYNGPWCLPRIHSKPKPSLKSGSRASSPAPEAESPGHPPTSSLPEPAPTAVRDPSLYHLPLNSHPLLGTISSRRSTLLSCTPPDHFDLIILDPPWPNRSAKRKRSGAGAYSPAPDLSSMHTLLRQIPVASRLAPGGLVAVWVTNAARFADLLTRPRGGLFAAEWNVELVGEWTWLKVTTQGEPVVGVGSGWRKPWERLLIARKRGGRAMQGGGLVPGKVIVSVPDVHSRKPNLRRLFEELLPKQYEALEVFARNLTAGWWAWGDEVLLFQRRECWVDGDEVEEEETGNSGEASRS
ncbi:MT-A70-domain-containing protein [Parathielavia appendiculata]|uniref:MT-A70-domain-containing protein n=1 Tax=Parathielavia appendiculata TaxID=2587402 RepID=A0AAN6Z585_9PEZI|nr:MT-A70-domain-containing protein [Parathielavia appendiculata]